MRYEDEIYHSGYLDGYYASMALYHSDEMTEEERRARRKKKRRRNIALGIVGAGALGAGGYYGYKKMQKENEEMGDAIDRVTAAVKRMKSAPEPKSTVKGFRRNPGTYKINPVTGDFGSYLTLHGMHIKARQRPYKK